MKTFLTHLLLSAIAVFAPIQGIIITVGVLIFADLITGLWKSWKKGDKITSNRLKRTVAKMVMYQTAVVTAFLLETYILIGLGLPVCKLVAGVIGVVEFKSMLENIETVTGINFKGVITRLQNPHTLPEAHGSEDKSPK